jgi:radical SAM protein with 4Fe4S-binding SPASM domain
MTGPETQETTAKAGTPFRVDVQLHDLLMKSGSTEKLSPALQPKTETLSLPTPPFPQRTYERDMTEREYHNLNTKRAFVSWAWPFAKSLYYRKDLRPIIAYLFTEFKCNIDCHYCWSFNNNVKGMSEDTGRRAIDWLESIGCRVLALMGGEPLLRPDYLHKIIYYAAKKGFFVYLPTNGRLMRPEVLDRIGDAGLSTINLAIDCVNEKPGLPKALNRIQPYFEYMVKNQRKYGYTAFININITHINQDDVVELTEIARKNGLATDYHLNEAPLTEQSHFKHMERNETYLTPDDFPKVEALLDYLMDKQRQGYKMANPIQHMHEMKKLMRGAVPSWPCRAGQNNLIIRPDGTLAPCFPMYSASYDWGTVGNHKFDNRQLDEMKKECSTHCLSTCNFILSHCYSAKRVTKWMLKQARHGFKGVTGSFDN